MSAKTILALDTKTGDQATVHTPPEHLQWLSVDFIKERLADPYRCSGGPQDRVFLDYLLALVESLTAERDALRAVVARVEALAEEWRYKGQFGWGAWQLGEGPDPEGYVMDHCAFALRDALAGSEADTSEQETEHRCEPYYSRSECGQCGWQEQWCVTCSRQMCRCATDAMGADQ